MTEREITEKLHMCIDKAFGYLNEVGEEDFEDGEMFFCDGYFYILLHDGSLCKTTYTAEDFLMIRYRNAEEEDWLNPYVVIYMKNGDRLFYYNFEYADEFGYTWELSRVGHRMLEDNALIDFFEMRKNPEEHARNAAALQEVNVVEYEDTFSEQVKDLLVELQTYLASLDRRRVLVLKENFREDYFAYLMRELGNHEGKLLLARSGEEVTGLVACKIIQGGEEQDITTTSPKIGFISDLVVTEQARGRGVGTALLTVAEKYFAERECVFTQLEVFAPNRLAKRIYDDFGFKTNCLYMSKYVSKR